MSGQEKISSSVSFVVPALNEEKVVESVVRDIHSNVDRRVKTYEIILLDDGSTDHTGANHGLAFARASKRAYAP